MTSSAPAPAARAAVFMRGDHPGHLAKLDSLEADVVIVDFEDAVAESRRDEARRLFSDAMDGVRRGTRVWVRISTGDAASASCEADLEVVVRREVEAIVVPKAEDPRQLAALNERIGALERARSLPEGGIGVIPLIETAAGAAGLRDLLAAGGSRVRTLAFGPADYSADLGVPFDQTSRTLEFASLQIVQAARAAGLPQPLDGPFMAVRDEAGLIADSERSKALGFGGRLCIHPSQAAVVAAVYGGSDDDESSRRIVEAWEARDPDLSALLVDGAFVDAPIYRAAKQRLATQQPKEAQQ